MTYYSLVTYSLMCSAIVLGLLSLARLFFGTFLRPITRGFISLLVFILSLIPIKYMSLSMLLYSIFDIPSFLLFFICFFSIIRTFVNQIGFTIGYRGFLFLAILWLLLLSNAFGVFEWAYGTLGYKILCVSCVIAICYCIDRVCAIFMLMSFTLWLVFANTLDLYSAMLDSNVALFGWIMQSMPLYRNNFHVALLKPKIR
ncbi:hypothetical protein [Helicobacter trogontum]|uniref:Uncharacterized protein n=1 Tax=Helicobacter trogontum TaxID=50960 RepID=A0A4V6I395_9HELI|nr:hypothetical protein [Helicobacter trogontum]MCI5785846.1 hypothetical protein [Helicobacter trogontum]MDY5184879.1 hypothetical protein [Helicobacter trogontum]TLD99092.1 hypothetical protein LS80_002465 [Helicobacter trogontum]